jgi:hypothetical protein
LKAHLNLQKSRELLKAFLNFKNIARAFKSFQFSPTRFEYKSSHTTPARFISLAQAHPTPQDPKARKDKALQKPQHYSRDVCSSCEVQ